MYCKKCKNLLPENEFICYNCNFDNFSESAYQDTTNGKKSVKNKNQSPVFSVVVLFMLVCIGVVLFYSVNETSAFDNSEHLKNNTIKIQVAKKKFRYDDFVFTYPETFGTSTNTIFLKTNTDININIKELTAEQYNTLININECLDSAIKEIPTKTYAEDNSYSHLFTYNQKYYEIKVNYVNNPYSYTEDIQKSISNIINSIEINKQK